MLSKTPIDSTGIDMDNATEMEEAPLVATDTVEEAKPLQRVPKFKRRPALDGLRGLAVVAVVLFHASTPGWENGYAGVDVFFVLSGFLITSLVLIEIMNTGSLDFVQFYGRRSRRLLPASLLALLCTAIAYKIVANPLHVYENRDSFTLAAFYSANWRLLWASVDYFAPTAVSPVMHYWSLSVEEQFYVAWPLCFYWLVRMTGMKANSKPLLSAVIVLCVASFSRMLLIRSEHAMYAYLGTFERTYQLLAGAGVALAAFHVDFSRLNRTFGLALSWMGIVGPFVLGSSLLVKATDVGMYSTLCTLSLIIGLEIAQDSQVSHFLSWKIFRDFGKWSYSIYLWHWPIVVIGDITEVLPVDPLLRTVTIGSTSLMMGVLGFSLVEKPFNSINLSKRPVNKNGNLFWGRNEAGAVCWSRFAVISGLMMTCLVGGLCYVILDVPDEIKQIAEEAHGDAVIDDTSIKCFSDDERKNHVYLAGDSYGPAWNTAFQHLTAIYPYDYTLNWVGGCPWFKADRFWMLKKEDWTAKCKGLHKKIYEDLGTGKYNTLVLTSLGATRDLQDSKVRYPDEEWAQVVRDGSIAHLEDWSKLVDQIVILEPHFIPEEDPNDCLVLTPEKNCDQPASMYLGADKVIEIWRDVTREMKDVTTIELHNFFCEDGITCPALTPTGERVWQDRWHGGKGGFTFRASKLVYILENNCISLTEPKPLC